jgi:hypothetical protein
MCESALNEHCPSSEGRYKVYTAFSARVIRHTLGEMTVIKTAGSRSTSGIFLMLVNQV